MSDESLRSLERSISYKIDNVVSVQLETENRIIVSQDYIASEIDKTAFGIDRVVDGFESLGAAFEWGFSELVWQIEQTREVLRDILEVLQAPLDTQAKELKRRGEDAYGNGWIDDALKDFLESEQKNRYDFTIHQYLGNIYLFHKKNPKTAREYYEKAVKYSTPKSDYYASIALLHVGLVYHLQKDFQKAYEATLNAIYLSPDLYEAYYQHARYCANLGEYDEAIERLGVAIESDRYYCLKAEREKDFDVMKKQLKSLFEVFRNGARDQAKSEIERALESIQYAESHGAQDYAVSTFEAAEVTILKANDLFHRNSYFDYLDTTQKAQDAQEIAIYSSIESIEKQISETAREYGERKENCERSSNFFAKAFWAVIIIEIIVIFGDMDIAVIPGIFILIMTIIGLYCVAIQVDRMYEKKDQFYETKLTMLKNNLSEAQSQSPTEDED